MIFLWIGFLILGLVILYLYAIMPRMIKRPDRTPFEGKLYAHRGLFDNETDAPENSLPAFARAVEKGFGIEMDIQLTKDKVPVVFHDFTLKRACRTSGKVIDYTYDELKNLELFCSQEHIPTFEEALAVVDGRVPIIVELKIDAEDQENQLTR